MKGIRETTPAAIDTAGAKEYQTYMYHWCMFCGNKWWMDDGTRSPSPPRGPLVVTTLGELAPRPGAVVTQEWLAIGASCGPGVPGERPDAVAEPQIVGRYQARFRLALMTAVRKYAFVAPRQKTLTRDDRTRALTRDTKEKCS
jgi:hypothetical protein